MKKGLFVVILGLVFSTFSSAQQKQTIEQFLSDLTVEEYFFSPFHRMAYNQWSLELDSPELDRYLNIENRMKDALGIETYTRNYVAQSGNHRGKNLLNLQMLN